MFGGDQGWWSDSKPEEDKDDMSSPAYRMKELGCGVIAMTDLELYLTQQHDGYSAPSNSIEYNHDTGLIKKNDYMHYAEFNIDHYRLGDDPIHHLFGVTPYRMEQEMEKYLSSNKHSYMKVTWAPSGGGKDDEKIEIANKIEKMISRDLPVVFSYFSFFHKIGLYQEKEDAKVLADINRAVGDSSTDSHYMTVIGYTKYLKYDGLSYSYVLEVVSWGKIYYINYDEYAEKLSYFSNILEIGE